MSDPLAVLRAILQSDAQALTLIAQNVANADTPGYQRSVAVSAPSFDAVADQIEASDHLGAPTAGYDPTPGALKPSSEPTHLALGGTGYFVAIEDDRQVLTRRGDFHVNRDGLLVTIHGGLVQGAGGPIAVGSGKFEVANDGRIRVDGREVDRLLVVEPLGPHDVVPLGDGRMVATASGQVREVDWPSVRQGFIESSNVSAVQEMVDMMQLLRHFETAQRFARGADDMLSTAISTLGRP